MADTFKIQTERAKMSSINRTIRFRPDIFDRLDDLSKKNGVSFNNLVGQCVEYALTHLEDNE